MTGGRVGRDLEVLQVEPRDLLERGRCDRSAPDRAAGLVDVRTVSGPFGMLTPRGFVVDEGFRRILVILGRASSRIAYLR